MLLLMIMRRNSTRTRLRCENGSSGMQGAITPGYDLEISYMNTSHGSTDRDNTAPIDHHEKDRQVPIHLKKKLSSERVERNSSERAEKNELRRTLREKMDPRCNPSARSFSAITSTDGWKRRDEPGGLYRQ
jgi:hypothetical protein